MIRIFLLLVTWVFTSGCASILSSSEQEVSINSNVKGASISLNGRKIGVTPFTGKVPRQTGREGTRLSLSKKGYETQTSILTSDGVNPMFWLNAIITVGSITDVGTGAMWQISPSNIYVEMKRKGTSSTQLKNFKHSKRVKDFVFKNYHHLLRESSSKSKGKYFQSLTKIVRTKSLKRVKTLFAKSKDPRIFAESLLN